jgi:hypothetical protein
VTSPTQPQPGDRRPQLDRAPGERYATAPARTATPPGRADALVTPLALILGTALTFAVLGGVLAVTAGLVIVAGFLGWLTGRLVSPPVRAALVADVAVIAGLLAIWAFGRIEGGVLDPIAYLAEVEGPIVVVLCLLAGGSLAAASSR